MQEVIAPIERELLLSELKESTFLRPTNKAGNLIYDVTAHTAPNVMRELGRLRELSYRASGGGTGKDCDVDDMDMMEKPYHQLLVFDPDDQQIVGGYRYMLGSDMKKDAQGQPMIASSHLFHYSNYFMADYMPQTIELGRAFVNSDYQKREKGVKALFALDNIWDGLGAIFYNNKEVQYLIGKVTMYQSFDKVSRDLIYAYLMRYCYDNKALIWAHHPLELCVESQEIADEIFIGDDPTLNFHILQRAVRARGQVIPPMFSAYLNLTDKMKTFGTAVNDEFGDVLETGIMVDVKDIYEEKRHRYIGAYIDYLKDMINQHKRQKTVIPKK